MVPPPAAAGYRPIGFLRIGERLSEETIRMFPAMLTTIVEA
jgi:hypothetical protein